MPVMVCLYGKVYWRNNISLKKGKGGAIIQLKDLIKIILKFTAEEKVCAHLCHAQYIFLRVTK